MISVLTNMPGESVDVTVEFSVLVDLVIFSNLVFVLTITVAILVEITGVPVESTEVPLEYVVLMLGVVVVVVVTSFFTTSV